MAQEALHLSLIAGEAAVEDVMPQCTLGTLGGSSGHDCETVFFDLFRSGKYSKVHVNTCEHMLAHVNTCGHMLTHVKTCKKAVFEVWTMWFLDG